jgi:hypothetical protein
MDVAKTIAGSGLALMIALAAPVAWGQSVPEGASHASGGYYIESVMGDSATLMDQNVSREIRQAWSENKNATAAMALQENGEIAMQEGKETQARQYFQAAEEELQTLQPDNTSY